MRNRKTIGERFWAKVNKTESCWLWTAGLSSTGYGMINVDGKAKYAHRISFLMAGNHIPEGFDLDHLCRTPRCVNPAHLEAVTHRENVRRGTAGFHMRDKQASRKICRKGHPVTPETTRMRGAWMTCRICQRIAMRNLRARANVAA